MSGRRTPFTDFSVGRTLSPRVAVPVVLGTSIAHLGLRPEPARREAEHREALPKRRPWPTPTRTLNPERRNPTMAGKRPDYVVSTVVGANGGQSDRWREIGVGFVNEKGSITVLLDALPVSGKLVLTVPKERTRSESAT